MSEDDFSFPVVDFSPFLLDEGAVVGETPTPAQLETAKAIHSAGTTHGFVCLRNCGVHKHILTCAFDASENLFHLSDEEKSQLKRLNVHDNTGYSPLGGERLNVKRRADLKEVFNVRNQGTDYRGTPNGFDAAATNLWNDVIDASRRYTTCCAVALQLPPDYFSKTIDSVDQCTLRMLHYQPVFDKTGDCDLDGTTTRPDYDAIRIGEHTDFGLFTFLFVRDPEKASSHGLQVKAVEGGDLTLGRAATVKNNDCITEGWSNVVLDESILSASKEDTTAIAIVNTGALLARWTNDVWRATAHRVIVSLEAASSSRYSIACFIDPDSDTLCEVHETFVPPGEEPKYPPVTAKEYLQMKLREAQGTD